MRRIALVGASLIMATTLVGCGGDEEGMRDNNNGLGVEQTRYGENNNLAPNRERIQMDRDEFGPDYDNRRNVIDNGRNNFTQNDNNGNYHNNDVTRDNNNNNNRLTNVRNRNNNMGNNDEGFNLADQIADRITTEIREVDQAYVFTGPENAYVAVVLDRNNELTDDVEDSIRRIVRTTERDIDDVFISANPNFAGQARDYANQLQAGEPVEGLFEEMGDMFERVFPNLSEINNR